MAERDLDEIWLYLAEEASPTTADRLIDDLVYFGSKADAINFAAEKAG